MKHWKILCALMCVGALVLGACTGRNGASTKTHEGEELVNPSQLNDIAELNDSIQCCWELSMWCDGTVIGKEWTWTTEAVLAYMVKQSMYMDSTVYGRYTKKYWYNKTKDATENACDNNVWAGCVCWEETVSAGGYSETTYNWLPEANMEERHAYIESKGATHTYKRVDAATEEACWAMNPQDTTIIPPVAQKFCWEVTIELTGAVSQTYYLWRTEAEVQAYVSGIELSGKGTASYKMAAAEDENSCNAKNANPGE